jgi:hypothetical protein
MSGTNGSKGFLTAADIFAVPLKTEIVEVFGGKVMVQQLKERNVGVLSADDTISTELRGYRVMLACVVDPETKQPIFTDADLERLPDLANAEMRKISAAIQRVNGWTVEEVKKNLDLPIEDSVTVLPPISG